MGGIGGYVGAPAADHCEGALLQALHHRGPDDEATASLDRGGAAVRLCFTRLSILDLSSQGRLPAAVHSHCDLSLAQRAALPAPEQLSYLEIHNYLRSTLLRDADVMSMAYGVELRVPLEPTCPPLGGRGAEPATESVVLL